MKSPLFININCERHRWHCGIGEDVTPKVDRLEEMSHVIPIDVPRFIRKKNSKDIENIWIQVNELLQKR